MNGSPGAVMGQPCASQPGSRGVGVLKQLRLLPGPAGTKETLTLKRKDNQQLLTLKCQRRYNYNKSWKVAVVKWFYPSYNSIDTSEKKESLSRESKWKMQS